MLRAFRNVLLALAFSLVIAGPLALGAPRSGGPKQSDLCAFLFKNVGDRKLRVLRWSEGTDAFTDAKLEQIFKFANDQRKAFGEVETGVEALKAFQKSFAKKYKNGEFLVVLEGDEVVATAAMQVKRTGASGVSGELQKLYLSHDLRGAGIGSKLLEATEDFARSRKVDRIRLETYSGMAGAQTLYEAKGYLVQGYFAESVGSGRDVVQSAFVRSRGKLNPEEIAAAKQRFAKGLQANEIPAKSIDLLYVYEKPLTVLGRRELLGEHFVKDLWADPNFGGEYLHSLAKVERTDPELFALLKAVGFEFKDGKVVRIPDQLEFIRNYDAILRKARAAGKETPGKMVPVMVEKTADGFVPYHGLDYAKDPDFTKRVFVEDLSPENKRLPDEIFIAMFASGETPVMNLHDIHHMLALAKTPELKTAIRAAYETFAKNGHELTLVQNRVLGYALESLSLGNIAKRGAFPWALKGDLRFEAGALERAYAAFDASIGKTPKEIGAAALEFEKFFDEVFGAYSASANSIVEREYELRNFEKFWKDKDEAFLDAFSPDRARKYTEDLALPRESFDEDPFYWPMRVRRYLQIFGDATKPEPLRVRAAIDLRKFLVRAGFFLEVTTRKGVLPPARWMEIMQELALGNARSVDVMAIQKLYGLSFGENSVTYRMFFKQFAPQERGMSRGMSRGFEEHRTRGMTIEIEEERNPDLPWR